MALFSISLRWPRRVASIFFSMCWSVMLTSCPEKNREILVINESNVIPVGFVDSFSGERYPFTHATKEGVLLAIDSFNQRGGVAGRKIRLLMRDDEADPSKTPLLAQQLIEQENVLAILGASASSRSLEMAPIAQKLQTPMMSASSTNPKVTQVGNYIFRACFIDTFQGSVMASFLRKELGIKRVAVFTDIQLEYSIGLANYFKKMFVGLGGEIVADESYQGGAVDYRPQLNNIRKVEPELIYVPGFFADAGQIAQQARAMGIHAQFAGGDGWNSADIFRLNNGALVGSYFTNHFSDENPDQGFQAFKKLYQQRYGKQPEAFAALGYDAAMMLIQALEQVEGEITREKLRDQIAQVNGYAGATGTISFQGQQDPKKPAALLKVAADKIQFISLIEP